MWSAGPFPQQFDVVENPVNPTPSVDFVTPSVFVAVLGETPVTIDFRILDSYHDVDLSSVTVTNHQADPPVTVQAYYAADQIRAEGGWGWMVAEIPGLTTGDASIEIYAEDLAGNVLSDFRTLIVETPRVRAQIASPASGSSFPSFGQVTLDGSTSMGPADMEARWVFEKCCDQYGDPIFDPDLDDSGLIGQVEMPAGFTSVMARLVVATPGNLPVDLHTVDLPCSIYAGDGDCDSIEIELFNSCCPTSTCFGDEITGLSLSVLTPGDGTTILLDQPLSLEALLSGGAGQTYTYRWWAAPVSNPSDRILLTPGGAGLVGFDPTNSSVEVDFMAAGIGPGSYVITAEGGAVEDVSGNGCIGGLETASITINVTHQLSTVAPGQTFPGDTVRVYGETFTAVDAIIVRIDDDSDHGAYPYEVLATATDGRWVEITLPADMPAGIAYYVAVAASDGQGESAWKQALEIVYPGYDEPGVDDPSCTGIGQEAANPIVPGQVVTGDFCDAGDTDYFYFPAAAGSTFDISLERVDETLSVYHPDSIDPEIFVINPDGVAPASGYSGDNSADDTNASLTGFTTTQTGLFGIACRTSRASGQYRLTINRTGTPNNSNFSVVPYGDRAVNIRPQAGSDPTASFQALVFDPFGMPSAGTNAAWQITEGAARHSVEYSSNTMGLTQGTFVLDQGADSATVRPVFEWPAPISKSDSGDQRHDDQRAGIQHGVVLLGVVRLSPEAVILASGLPDQDEVKRIINSSHVALQGNQPDNVRAPKILAACTDPTEDSLAFSKIEMPLGAASVLGVSLEFVDPSTGQVLGPDLPGLVVAQQYGISFRLIAHCLDVDEQPFDAPLPGAKVEILSSAVRPIDSGGFFVNFGTCTNVIYQSVAEETEIVHETGRRSVLSHVDEYGLPNFFFTELLRAETKLLFTDDDSGITTTFGRWADVEVEPEHGEPAGFQWLESKVIREVQRSHYDAGSPKEEEYIKGSAFVLMDEFGNAAHLWGQHDSTLHRDPSDLLRITAQGVRGEPPWAGINNSLEILFPMVFVKDIDSDEFKGVTNWEICADTSTSLVCDTFTLDNTGELNVIDLHGPWPSDLGGNNGGYVPAGESNHPSSTRTVPGGELVYLSGKQVLWRIHPVNTGDLDQPHSQPFTDLPVKIWLNGPSESQGNITHWARENRDDLYEPSRATDVVFSLGSLTLNSDGTVVADMTDTPTIWVSTVASTETLDPNEPDVSGPLGKAIGIKRAPKEAGYYSIMVESEDDTFYREGQRRFWNAGGFSVMGGFFLDEEMVKFPDEVLVGSDRTINLSLTVDSALESLPVTVEFEAQAGGVSSVDFVLPKVGVNHLGFSQFIGPVKLTTPAGGIPGSVTITGKGSLFARVEGQVMAQQPASEIWVEIETIYDRDENDVTGTVLDVKTQGPFDVQYRVKGTEMVIQHERTEMVFTINPADDPESVRGDFYGDPYLPVSAVTDEYPEVVINKLYRSSWNGRDSTSAERILLAGVFELSASVRFHGIDDWVWSEVIGVETSPPHASNYGPVFSSQWQSRDYTMYSGPPRTTQSPLLDGTSFDQITPTESSASTAQQAWDSLKDSDALMSWGGHSAPGFINYYSSSDLAHNDNYWSVFASHSGMTQDSPLAISYSEDFQADDLKDVFFVMLLGCQTAQPLNDAASNLPWSMIAKGADLTMGFSQNTKYVLGKSFSQLFWAYSCRHESELSIYDAQQLAAQDLVLLEPGFDLEDYDAFLFTSFYEAPRRFKGR